MGGPDIPRLASAVCSASVQPSPRKRHGSPRKVGAAPVEGAAEDIEDLGESRAALLHSIDRLMGHPPPELLNPRPPRTDSAMAAELGLEDHPPAEAADERPVAGRKRGSDLFRSAASSTYPRHLQLDRVGS